MTRRGFSRLAAIDPAWRVAALIAVLFLAAHLPYLASTLEDLDSINFALGVRQFDPTPHRPHPPGYPIYIALSKMARWVMSEPHALAFWPALFGALAVFPLLRLFQCLDGLDPGSPKPPPGRWPAWLGPPMLAMLVTVTSPLYWMTALRPLSDTVGLAMSLLSHALLASALVRQARDVPDARGQYDRAVAARYGRLILLGAFTAALAIGVRSQGAWLTVPLLIGMIAARTGRGAAGAMIGAGTWFVLGVLAWFVPLIIASGGATPYFAALNAQAVEDWSGVDLLATNLTLRRLAFGLYDTLIPHWAGLGWLIAGLAVLGAVVMIGRSRRGFVLLLGAFLPYALFHVFFQESITYRYAMPLLPAVVYLAMRGAWTLGRVAATATAAVCVLVSLAQVVPVAADYSAGGSPVSRALADVSAEGRQAGSAVLGRHFVYARAIEAELDAPGVEVLPGDPKVATLALGEFIVRDDRTPVWFLADPERTDLALIDPSSRILLGWYRWDFPAGTFLGHARPGNVDWIEIRNPGWIAREGWHLTPETAGIAVATGKGLGVGPISAAVRSRPGAARLMVGGRHLGKPGDADLAFTLRIDGRVIDEWVASAASPFFLRLASLPAGTLDREERWAWLTVEARQTDTGEYSPLGAIEQFDLQDEGNLMVGYGAGWHELELAPATGVLWRWAGLRAELNIPPVGKDLNLQIVGEVPADQFESPSNVVVRAGDRELLKTTASGHFAWSMRLPADALEASGGVVTIETNQVFRPADVRENADRRQLGLRVFRASVRPAS